MIDNSESDIQFIDISLGKLIGNGHFASVYIGAYFGEVVAIKKQIRDKKPIDEYLIREISILKKVKHENIITYIGVHNEINDSGIEHSLYIVSEYCQNGDLLDLLLNKEKQFEYKFLIKIAIDTINALNHLHVNNYIHRDIKSANLLLDNNYSCKICDFGMAREVFSSSNSNQRMTLCGTNEYMAPGNTFIVLLLILFLVVNLCIILFHCCHYCYSYYCSCYCCYYCYYCH